MIRKNKGDKMNKIRKATSELRKAYEDNNHHTDALIAECLEEGRYDLIIELSKIAQAHEARGHLLSDEDELRSKIADCLLDGTSL